MSQPFPSTQACDEAVKAFNTELRALREKYKLPEVYVILYVNFLDAQGDEGRGLLGLHHGDVAEAEVMTAWAFGTEQARRQERIGRFLSMSMKDRRTDSKS